MRYRYLTADVFTDTIFGGNPLAVFPEAQGLDDRLMQRIARELNISETVFVFPPEDARHTRSVRIFTPGMELPFAGHPTIGAAFVLALIGEVPLVDPETEIVLEEQVGPVPVTIRSRNGRPTFAQLSAAQPPEIRDALPAEQLAALLDLSPDDLLMDPWGASAVSCGVPFQLVPVRDRSALARAQLQLGQWKELLAGAWAPHVYVFTPDAAEPADIRARMFAPAMQIVEDPATGAAATALAGYLGRREDAVSGSFRWVVEQGIEMGRPSTIEIEADKQAGSMVSIRIGGGAVLVAEGTMRVPSAAG